MRTASREQLSRRERREKIRQELDERVAALESATEDLVQMVRRVSEEEGDERTECDQPG